MLQLLYTIDYKNRKAGLKATVVGNKYYPTFFLNLLIIISQLLKPITQLSDWLFNNITLTFKNWRALYSSKYIYSLLFNLKYCTF
jgi:hypothetical protein